jgi:lipid-binding SYLF domain-containing protein
MKKWMVLPIMVVMFGLLLAGPMTRTASAKEDEKPSEKKAKIDANTKETLAKLFKESKDAKSLYDKSYGYAAFSATKVIFGASGGGGNGEAVVRGSSKKTYMKMATGGVGLGIGAQKYEIIFLFQNKETFDKFVEKGWQGGAGVSAAAGDEGANKGVAFKNGVAVFQFTKKGLVVSADLSGSKFWKDKDLN